MGIQPLPLGNMSLHLNSPSIITKNQKQKTKKKSNYIYTSRVQTWVELCGTKKDKLSTLILKFQLLF